MSNDSKTIYDALIIGAGQAGLATAYHLQREGLRFAVLEAGDAPTGSWPRYYESLTLFSPAHYSSLPGFPFPGDPDRYPHRDEVSFYLRTYAAHFQFPIYLHSRVEQIEWADEIFHLRTATGASYHARTVIAATGSFSRPNFPQFKGLESFGGRILHSCEYRRPQPFWGQRIAIVGAGNSAMQIGVELARVAPVSLTSRKPITFRPQRFLGQDIHFWAHFLGLDRLPGVKRTPVLDPGIYQAAIAAGSPDWRPLFERLTREGVIWADGSHETVDTLLFATGYRPNLEYLVSLGALDSDGQALQHKGRSLLIPGLYYVGFEFQRNFASATLRGVGPDTKSILPHLQEILGTPDELRAPQPGLPFSKSTLTSDSSSFR